MEIIYYVIYRLIKNKRSICIIAFILALIAHYSRTEGVPNYFFWSSTIEAMLFFSLGTLFNDPIKIEKHLSKLGGAVSCVICIIIAAFEFKQTGRYLDLSDGYLCMEWVRRMNNLENRAAEIIKAELIYTFERR